jgi:ribose transport system permease protein
MTTTTEPDAAREAEERGTSARSGLQWLVHQSEFTLGIFLILLCAVLSLAYPQFLTAGNISNILQSISAVAIVGIGMTMVILTAGIDVSVGSAQAVCAVLVAQQLVAGNGWPVAVLVGVVAGLAIGLVNGLLVGYGRVHSIIITFGMLNLLRFLSYQLQGGEWVTGIPSTLAPLGNGRWLGVPIAWWLAMALAVVGSYYLRWRPTGRHIYAVGNDPETARLAGVAVVRRRLSVFVVTGMLVGVSSLVLVGGTGVVQLNAGTGFELQVIAAVVLGGTSIVGGRGSVIGTLIGALLLGVVRNALVIAGAPSLLQGFFIGLLILVAVGLDLFRQRGRSML